MYGLEEMDIAKLGTIRLESFGLYFVFELYMVAKI